MARNKHDRPSILDSKIMPVIWLRRTALAVRRRQADLRLRNEPVQRAAPSTTGHSVSVANSRKDYGTHSPG